MKYKNNSRVSRRFYGITIKPGEIKDFPGYVNDYNMIRVTEKTPTQTRKNSTLPSKEKIKNSKPESTAVEKTTVKSEKAELDSKEVAKQKDDNLKYGGES